MGREKLGLFGRKKDVSANQALTHYHTMLHFDALMIYNCENLARTGEIACNKQFLLFLQCFLPSMVFHFQFKCTLKCCLYFVSIWISQKICRLEMVGTWFFHFCLNCSHLHNSILIQSIKIGCYQVSPCNPNINQLSKFFVTMLSFAHTHFNQ